MQQIWSVPGILEKFLSVEESARLRVFFTGLYGLQKSENPQEIIAKVIAKPSEYVMKPQREGGGSLLFHESMVAALKTMTPEEVGAYIIMDRIIPPEETTYFQPKPEIVEVLSGVSELGTYGIILANGDNYVLNKCGGLLLRTKPSDAEDGGVCSGVAFLSSIYEL